MNIAEPEAALTEAREHERTVIGSAGIEKWKVVHESTLQAERALAAAKGEPYAVPMGLSVSWGTGTPLPHLLRSDYQTFLLFYLREFETKPDESFLELTSNDGIMPEGIALVEFERCHCAKMGTPNDEVLQGHPLYGKGLSAYDAFLVENSTWIKELEAINSVHSHYTPETWRDLKHFILLFHDSTFECVAKGFKVEKWRASLPSILGEVCKRLSS